jgi:hypothetical protein
MAKQFEKMVPGGLWSPHNCCWDNGRVFYVVVIDGKVWHHAGTYKTAKKFADVHEDREPLITLGCKVKRWYYEENGKMMVGVKRWLDDPVQVGVVRGSIAAIAEEMT